MYNQIYSIVYAFIKAVESNRDFSFLLKNWNGKRGQKRKFSAAQVISLNLLRFSMHVKDLKAFHRIVKAADLIPGMPNYENFLKALDKSFPIAALLMRLLVRQNQLENVSAFTLSTQCLCQHA